MGLLSFFLFRPLMIFPRFKAAALIGTYTRFRDRGDVYSAIKCLHDIVNLSTRPKRRLKDDTYLIAAYNGLFYCYGELNNYDDAIKYGMEAVIILAESTNSGWKLCEDSGYSYYQFLIDMKHAIQYHGGNINSDNLRKLYSLIETVEQYKEQKS